MPTDYKEDRFAWTAEQGKLMRQARFDEIDKANIADEIEQLARDDQEIIRERLRILLTALLRWAYQADLRTTALSSTIVSQRITIERILEDSASLHPMINELIVALYPEAKRLAVIESGLFEESFPEGLPFLPDEVLDLYFLPDPFNEDASDAWWHKHDDKRAERPT